MAGQRRLDEQAVASMRGVVITEGVAADHDQLRSVLRRAREAVEASGAVLVVSNATDGLDVVATIGCDPADIEHFRHIAADADVPLAECVRLNDRVSCESAAERAERYPELAQVSSAADPAACTPVRHNGVAVGALGVAFRGSRRLSPADWAMLEDLADSCSDLGIIDSGAAPEVGPAPDLGLLDDPVRRADLIRLGLEDGEVGESVARLTRLAARLLNAGRAQVSLLGSEQIVASTAGFTLPAGARRAPLSESLCSVTVASGGPLDIADAPRHPWVRDLPPVRGGDVRRYLGIPLVTSTGAAIGALCVYDAQAARWSDDAKDTLRDLAASVVTELELRAAARRMSITADRLGQLQAVTARLTGAATTEAIAEILVDQGIALIAPHGALGVASADGTHLQTWLTPALPEELVPSLRRLPVGAPTQLSEAIRTGAPVVLQSRSEIAARFPEMLPAYLATGTQSAVAVPAVVGERVLGALAFGFATDNAVDADVMVFAQSMAQLTAQALDRARLYEREREAAHQLQQALLPSPALDLSGVRAAMCYRPADEDHDAGGDWYDFFPLPGDRVGVVVGDIVGHDLRAAAAMGRLHSVLRVIAAGASGPAAVLEALDEAVPAIPGADLATVGYGEYDPATGALRYACAGHLPPLLVSAGHEATFLDRGRSEPLGISTGSRPEATVEVAPGSLLLWYTDGLVERRDEDIDQGLHRLQRLSSRLADADPQTVCDTVIAAMSAGGPLQDDVALICLRLGTL